MLRSNFSIVFPEDEFIHEDLKRDEYIQIRNDGLNLDEVPRLLHNPIEIDAIIDQCIDDLITEEEALAINAETEEHK